jgi:hypothetical protein
MGTNFLIIAINWDTMGNKFLEYSKKFSAMRLLSFSSVLNPLARSSRSLLSGG